MKKLKVNLENCYWIKKIDYIFDFEKSNVYSIYAPNWTMKTSFLKGFLDYTSSEWRKPSDKVNNIEWDIILKDENDLNIDKEKIFPIESLNLSYSNDFSSLLINPKYKKEFDWIYLNIEEQKTKLIRWLMWVSKVPQSWMEDIIMKDYWYEWWTFYEFLKLKIWWIDFSDLNDYENVFYKIIFSEKAKKLLDNPKISSNIKDYKKEYERVLKQYSCFNIWWFNLYKANSLLSEIKKTSYFTWTNNTINLNKDNWEIKTDKEFKDFIDHVKSEIANNKDLELILNLISKWTKDVHEFQEHIEKQWHKFISKLDNPIELKKDLWNYYFKENIDDLNKLTDLYDLWIKKLNQILDDADKYEAEWHKTIKIFEDRFYIDFKIDIDSKKDVVVWRKRANLNFIYNHEDDENKVIHTKESLLSLNILSWWEKRVLYLLYIIFWIELRKKEWWNHLFIIDDIADSFDYKNKYAIIEYLQEVSEFPWFNVIILTHNFDFYRNIQMRLWLKDFNYPNWNWSNLAVKKNIDWNIKLINWNDYLNPINDFKNNCHKCKYKLIALIPVARNLIEYMLNDSSDEYKILTWMLHVKNTEYNISQAIEIYKWLFSNDNLDENLTFNTKDLIYDLCDEIIKNNIEEIELEKKIVLSIWIRLKAEDFMRTKLWMIEKSWVQTRLFYNDCIDKGIFNIRNKWEINEEKIVKQVLLMTPEAIHVNSFMYEPIIDMWDWHLRQLYKKVKQL